VREDRPLPHLDARLRALLRQLRYPPPRLGPARPRDGSSSTRCWPVAAGGGPGPIALSPSATIGPAEG
jgi:hypothetical protein